MKRAFSKDTVLGDDADAFFIGVSASTITPFQGIIEHRPRRAGLVSADFAASASIDDFLAYFFTVTAALILLGKFHHLRAMIVIACRYVTPLARQIRRRQALFSRHRDMPVDFRP